MIRSFCWWLLFYISGPVLSQQYSVANIFAHNDYLSANPFHGAYNAGAGYIEADIFLREGQLLVAHTAAEIEKGKTLERLYLEPLQSAISKNGGKVSTTDDKTLMLMIDLKSEGMPTLTKLVEVLKNYKTLTSCQFPQLTISGDVPDPSLWKQFPAFIYFDGRPGIAYNEEQLSRINMISTSFRSVSAWDGKAELSAGDRVKILNLIDAAHAKGKKMRFWATPDTERSWQQQMQLGFDMIVTDRVSELVAFLSKK